MNASIPHRGGSFGGGESSKFEVGVKREMSFTQEDVDGGLVYYKHTEMGSGAALLHGVFDSFTFNVSTDFADNLSGER